MINCILIDDELNALKILELKLKNNFPECNILAVFQNPEEALQQIESLQPDLVFLDIEMPEIDGFQLLQLLDYRNFDLIITTAYNQYAIQAFKANAIDYLLKPVDPDDLLQAIEKVKTRLNNNTTTKNIENVLNNLLKKEMQENRKIPISVSNKIILVEPDEILYLKSDGSYTTIFLKDGKEYLASKNIKFFEDLLPEPIFLRIHKSYIVNIREIKEFLKHGNGEVVLSNDKIIPVSRRHRQDILNALHIS